MCVICFTLVKVMGEENSLAYKIHMTFFKNARSFRPPFYFISRPLVVELLENKPKHLHAHKNFCRGYSEVTASLTQSQKSRISVSRSPQLEAEKRLFPVLNPKATGRLKFLFCTRLNYFMITSSTGSEKNKIFLPL